MEFTLHLAIDSQISSTWTGKKQSFE